VNPGPEISVVIPCLNEARTVTACVRRAHAAFTAGGLAGEVIVADNGSTDGSPDLAAAAGARVIPVPARGYGHALMAGIAAAHGRFIVMGDADGSYDFGAVPALVNRWREGFDLVQGCRLPRGGGRIEPGAMPWLHRRLGNPLLSWLARRMFRTPLHDIYCGLRGFSRDFYERANLRCTGMEFATEMIIKAAQLGIRTAEVPITLHRDGRGGAPSHLRTFRDGWRTLRLFLLCSPRWLFFVPGTLLVLAGLAGSALALAGARLGPATLGAHTLLVSCLFLLVGAQTLSLAIFAHTFAVAEGLQPAGRFIGFFYRWFNLEKALLGAAVAGIAGIALIAKVWLAWRAEGYGPLNYPSTLRSVIPGVTLVALATQTAFNSFMVSLLGLNRK
jgi:glycosyltransferase involved in cell wall biosynthesis